MRILLIAALCWALSAQAQEVENVQISMGTMADGVQKYFISYDLIAPHSNIPCLVHVRFTAGASTFYLKLVTGDVGNKVLPGKGKRIAWDFQEELIHFSSSASRLDIEVFPNVTVPPKVKRSKMLTVRMDSIYVRDKKYRFVLYQREKEVVQLKEMPITQNSFLLLIPRKTKVRRDYQLGIADGESVLFSNTFKVKPKVSNFWKVLPFAIVPAYILFQRHQEENKDLPGVPDIPAN